MRSERRPRRSWPHPEVRRRYLQSRRCRAGAFSEARFRIERSWNSNSDRTGFPGLLFDLLNETCDELNTTVIIVSGRRFAPSRQFFAIFSESNPLNLGSSPINADQHKQMSGSDIIRIAPV